MEVRIITARRIISLTVPTPKKRVNRRARRYPVRWTVSELNGKPARDAWVVDVSCLGARLETTFSLGPHNPVQFTVLLPDGEAEMVFTGRVVWMRPIFTSPGRFHQSLQFYGVNRDLEGLARKWRL